MFVVLKLAAREMPTFFILLGMILVSFSLMGTLLFGKTSRQYRDFATSLATMFISVLGYSGFKVNIMATQFTYKLNWPFINDDM